MLKVFQQDSSFSGYWWAIASAFLNGLAFPTSKILLLNLNVVSFCFYYYFSAFLGFIVLSTFQNNFPKVSIPGFRLKVVLVYFLEGFCLALFFCAIDLSNPSLIGFFNNFTAVFVVILGVWLLRESFGKLEKLALLLIIPSAFMMSYKTSEAILIGIIIMLIHCFLYAGIIISVKKLLKFELPPSILALWRSAILTIFFLIAGLFSNSLQVPNLKLSIFVFIIGILSPFLGYLAHLQALKLLAASKVSLIRANLPLFVLIQSFILIGTLPTIWQILGGLLSIIGVIILIKGHQKEA